MNRDLQCISYEGTLRGRIITLVCIDQSLNMLAQSRFFGDIRTLLWTICMPNFTAIFLLVSKLWAKNGFLDAFFCISLRQSWKKVVGTLKIYCHNHCSSINHGNEWDTSVFIRTRLPSDVPLSVPTPLNQCWKSCYDCGQHIWDQHCYGGMGAALQCKVIQTVPTFFSMIVWAKCKKMHLKFVFCS